MTRHDPLIVADGITKIFDERDRVILERVSLRVARGESLAITGPSGCGKTTLLSILAGLIRPDAGHLSYTFPGEAPASALTPDLRRRHIGIVFQSVHLIPTLTVLENIEVPLFGVISDRRARETRAREVLDMLGMPQAADWRPQRLSGGERQRVAVARAFANRPSVVFADEPTGNLDSVSSDLVVSTLIAMTANTGGSLVLVTHNLAIARRLDRSLPLMDGRLGATIENAVMVGSA